MKTKIVSTWNPASFNEKLRASHCKRALAICFALCTLGLSVSASAQKKPNITTFNIPGARETRPASINPEGAITGFYDVNSGLRGFLRSRDGTITKIDPPDSLECTWTMPMSINPEGAITGTYCGDVTYLYHGFLRSRDGSYTKFDPPGSVDTMPRSINPEGAITGWYSDATSWAYHGFLRAPDGTITKFDVEGATATLPTSINSGGAITGWYFDASFNTHGFLRDPEGTITTFDHSGSKNTSPKSINPLGAIAGDCGDVTSRHGFVRASDGAITTFDAGSNNWIASINSDGAITGYYYGDGEYVGHGFLRDPDGTITTFDPPGSTSTVPESINPARTITGYYFDATGFAHGFLADFDTAPPLITVSATPKILWPPNGELVPVKIWGKITDTGSGVLARTVEYAVTDEYHPGKISGRISLNTEGNYSFAILLRASREGNDKDGHQYKIRVSASDNAGNRASTWQAVTVPHDRR
jgi:hypothetical protein